MAQLTIYLDPQTEKKLEKIVKQKGISKSKWIQQLIREKAATTWPEHVSKLAGAWSDFPLAEQLRNTLEDDSDREPL